MKLISYIYSYSGDSGLCLSNREEWNTIDHYLYFDAEKWTMQQIYDTVKELYHKYESLGQTWTLSDVIKNVRKIILPFINETEGVYSGISWTDVNPDKLIKPEYNEHEITTWELNGETVNFDYRK